MRVGRRACDGLVSAGVEGSRQSARERADWLCRWGWRTDRRLWACGIICGAGGDDERKRPDRRGSPDADPASDSVCEGGNAVVAYSGWGG